MKRTLFGLLSSLPLAVSLAAIAQSSGDFDYTINGDGVTITGYSGSGGAVSIPAAIAGLPVISVGVGAFAYSSVLTSITLPDSVTSIGAAAFGGCVNLGDVAISDSATNIGDSAFCDCHAMTNIVIPDRVATIGAGAFCSCSSLTCISIPASVTTIGEAAFGYCSSLTNLTLSEGIANIGESAFYECKALVTVTIPASVATIGAETFSGCSSLTNVTLGPAVTSIGDSAFASCVSLASVTIPGSVTNIGAGAFSGCSKLASVYFQGDPPTVAASAFSYSGPDLIYDPASTNGSGPGVQPSAPLCLVQTDVLPAGGGTASGAGSYTNGAVATFDATPAPGCHFVDWTEGGVVVGVSNQLALAVTTNASLVANFATNLTDSISLSPLPGVGGRAVGTGTFPAGAARTVTALPGPGYLFANWTEGATVVSSSPSYTFTVRYDRDLAANFVRNPFPPVQGAYHGLFYDTTKGISPGSSGWFVLEVGPEGRLLGALHLGGNAYLLTGRLDTGGAVQGMRAHGAAGALRVDLAVDLVNGADRLTGRVSNGTWTADLAGNRAVFDGVTQVAPQAGSYTMILPGAAGATNRPAGDGYATLTVSSAGAISWQGALADGTQLTGSAPVSKSGQWPFYAPLCQGQGVLCGWLSFTNAATLGGAVAWVKPANGVSPYASGFSVIAQARGERYFAPGKGTNVLGFAGSKDLTLTLQGGGLAPGLASAVVLGANNQVARLGGPQLTLSFIPATGMFSGKVVDPTLSTPVVLGGVVLQGEGTGAGFFLGPAGSGEAQLAP